MATYFSRQTGMDHRIKVLENNQAEKLTTASTSGKRKGSHHGKGGAGRKKRSNASDVYVPLEDAINLDSDTD